MSFFALRSIVLSGVTHPQTKHVGPIQRVETPAQQAPGLLFSPGQASISVEPVNPAERWFQNRPQPNPVNFINARHSIFSRAILKTGK